jgi:DNA ligase (NAD+)
MHKFKFECDQAYESGCSIIPDDIYDILFPDDTSSIFSKENPFWLGSLNKIRTEKKLNHWLNTRTVDSFTLSCKLDGISALYFKNKLYSRTNTDLTKFLPFLNLPSCEFAVRGELIMTKQTFSKHFSQYKNARNLVAGQASRITVESDIAQHVCFVAYEIINDSLLHAEQFEKLKHMGFKTPIWTQINKEEICYQTMLDCLDQFREQSVYNIDGLVLTENKYKRNTEGNPSYAVAFKRNLELINIKATVTCVKWNLSAQGKYIPTIHVNPVQLDGITITKMTGYNAAYIKDNNIGKDSVIICERAGGVIPKIIEIVSCGLPPEFPNDNWDGVHLCSFESENDTKKLLVVLKALGIKHINEKTLEKCMTVCNLDSLDKLLNCTENDLALCFKTKTIKNILDEIQEAKTKPIKITTLVGAAGVLGRGINEKKINQIYTHFPNFFTEKPALEALVFIKGFSVKTADKIIINYDKMMLFLQLCYQHSLLTIVY